jgi:hypothetical protein
MSGHAMGALTVTVGAESFKLWLGMSVLADVQEAFPEQFEHLVSGTLPEVPPLRLMQKLLSSSLERYHPEKAADRFFLDELLNENASLLQDLLNASAPKPAAQPGNAKAPRTK